MYSQTNPSDREAADAPRIDTAPRGRRKGDAILIAFNHAIDQGDEEVASQLLIEYQKLNMDSPLLLSVERRRGGDRGGSALNHLWERFRSRFAS